MDAGPTDACVQRARQAADEARRAAASVAEGTWHKAVCQAGPISQHLQDGAARLQRFRSDFAAAKAERQRLEVEQWERDEAAEQQMLRDEEAGWQASAAPQIE